MEDLGHLCDCFIQNDGVPDGILDALRKFVTTEPRQIIELLQTHDHEEVEERAMLCGRMKRALLDAELSKDTTMTSVLWSLFMTVPMEQLRSFESTNSQSVVVHFLEMARTRLGILLNTCEPLSSRLVAPTDVSHLEPTPNTINYSPCKRARDE